MQYDFMATHRSWLETAFLAKDKKQYWDEWHNCYEQIDSDIISQFSFTPSGSAIEYLPRFSFMLRVTFKLRKPYLSKDDRNFHLFDNPVCKDKVFKTSMVGSTSWKGSLRSSLWQLGHTAGDDKTMIRLFGDAIQDETGQAGRLYFYPTFFDEIGLEVINPHDRKTSVGKNPILLECVPLGATGEFILLYVPFGAVKLDEIAADLKIVAEGVEKMLTVYGFGAKTSSGFGVVELNSKGTLAIRVNLPGQINIDFQHPDGDLKSEDEYKVFIVSQKKPYHKKLYQEVQNWWKRKTHPITPITEVFFNNLTELGDRTRGIAESLYNGGQA